MAGRSALFPIGAPAPPVATLVAVGATPLILQPGSKFRVVGEAETGMEAVQFCKKARKQPQLAKRQSRRVAANN
jgi:hypothetical protein